MAQFRGYRQIITTPFTNRSLQPRHKIARKDNLVTLTRLNREKLLQPRKINVGPFPLAIQQNWLATLKAKEAEDTATSQTPTPSHPMEAPGIQPPISPIPPKHTKYCAICTPLGKICPNEFPMCLDWNDNEEEDEERKDQNKGEDQKDSEGKTSQTSPRFLSDTTFTPQPPKSSIKQCSNRINMTPEKEEGKFDTLATLLGYESQETLEDID